jgi:hypothetical protein
MSQAQCQRAASDHERPLSSAPSLSLPKCPCPRGFAPPPTPRSHTHGPLPRTREVCLGQRLSERERQSTKWGETAAPCQIASWVFTPHSHFLVVGCDAQPRNCSLLSVLYAMMGKPSIQIECAQTAADEPDSHNRRLPHPKSPPLRFRQPPRISTPAQNVELHAPGSWATLRCSEWEGGRTLEGLRKGEFLDMRR